MRKKRRTWAGGLLALCMVAGMFGGGPVRAEGEDKLFETFPPSEYYDRLWVDDVLSFPNTPFDWNFDEHKDKEYGDANVARSQFFSVTLLNGEGVKPALIDHGVGSFVNGIRFSKPGKSTVKIKVTVPDTGVSTERTLSFTVSQRPADKPVTAKVDEPSKKTIKIGDPAPWKSSLIIENLNYGLGDSPTDRAHYSGSGSFLSRSDGPSGGIEKKRPGLDRTISFDLYGFSSLSACHPGTVTVQPKYNNKLIGNSSTITIEEPIITTNAPASMKVGSTLNLTTALTNTALKNLKTAEYEDKDHYWNDAYRGEENIVAYKPSVTVLEGKDCVTQSQQDYSSTLTSSETLTFKKAGMVKLKVTYTQFKTDMQMVNTLYHPEKIFTIQVTEDGQPAQPPKGTTTPAGTTGTKPPTGSSSVSANSAPGNTSSGETTAPTGEPTLSPVEEQPVILTNEETGIQLGAAEGVVPPDTALVVKPSDFVLEDAAGKFAAFDISLENGGAKIQPNGRVQVSIPVPAGYDKERLTIYHIADDGTKTELPCTVSGEAVTFETDHFSLYVLAEKAAVQAADGAPQPEKPGGSPVVWIVLAVVLLAAAGGGFALWWFKFRKKPDAEA